MGRDRDRGPRADNVIDLNFYALPYARITNHRYRPIGPRFGYHHTLRPSRGSRGSEEHPPCRRGLNASTTRSCSERLAEERSHGLFEGSDWQTGAYFAEARVLFLVWVRLPVREGAMGAEHWGELAEAVVARNGVRNAYLLAIALLRARTSILLNHAGHRPDHAQVLPAEKKGSMLPRVRRSFRRVRIGTHKPAHYIEQTWSAAPRACVSAISTKRSR